MRIVFLATILYKYLARYHLMEILKTTIVIFQNKPTGLKFSVADLGVMVGSSTEFFKSGDPDPSRTMADPHPRVSGSIVESIFAYISAPVLFADIY